MIILVLAVACLATFVPLVVAVAMKVKRIGAAVATLASLAILAVATWIVSLAIGLAEGGISWGVLIIAMGLALLCLLAGAFLYFTADDNN